MPVRKAKPRLSASARVEQHVRQAIYNGVLKPRERIIEEDLAKQLECSRGPVREALLRLERDGLIVTVSQRGAFIRDISAESIEVVFSMRAKLEALCVRYLRQELTERNEQLLREALGRLKSAVADHDEELFLQADMALHQTIWRLSNREPLYRTLTTVMNPYVFMVARIYSSRSPLRTRYLNHEEYVEMILTSPLSRVEKLVEEYFRRLFDGLGIQTLSPLMVPQRAAGTSAYSNFDQ